MSCPEQNSYICNNPVDIFVIMGSELQTKDAEKMAGKPSKEVEYPVPKRLLQSKQQSGQSGNRKLCSKAMAENKRRNANNAANHQTKKKPPTLLTQPKVERYGFKFNSLQLSEDSSSDSEEPAPKKSRVSSVVATKTKVVSSAPPCPSQAAAAPSGLSKTSAPSSSIQAAAPSCLMQAAARPFPSQAAASSGQSGNRKTCSKAMAENERRPSWPMQVTARPCPFQAAPPPRPFLTPAGQRPFQAAPHTDALAHHSRAVPHNRQVLLPLHLEKVASKDNITAQNAPGSSNFKQQQQIKQQKQEKHHQRTQNLLLKSGFSSWMKKQQVVSTASGRASNSHPSNREESLSGGTLASAVPPTPETSHVPTLTPEMARLRDLQRQQRRKEALTRGTDWFRDRCKTLEQFERKMGIPRYSFGLPPKDCLL